MKIAELFAEIGFKFDTIKLREVAKGIGDLNLSSVVSAAAVVKLGDVIKDLVVDSVQASNALMTLSNSTGLDTDYIQRFEKFAKALGSTKEEADSFLNTIGKLQVAISQGRGDASPFVLLGINPLGKSKEELVSLINQRFSDDNFLKEWAKNYAKNAKSTDEIRAELKRQVGGSLGISDSLSRVFSSKDLEKELNPNTSSFLVKTKEEIQDAIIAQREFITLTENLNTEFQRTADILLPKITELLQGFRDNGGLKFLSDSLATIGRAFEIIGIGTQYAKTGLMELGNLGEAGLTSATRFGQQLRGEGNKTQTNNITLHVTSNTPEEFVKRFDPIWKRHIANADLQFGQQT